MTRFLVLGATGMAGHVISIYLQERGHDVVGFCRKSASYVRCVEGDALDVERLDSVIGEGSFDVIVNAIGILGHQAEVRKDLASYLNACLPHRLAAITEGTSTRVFHMSTDCVFAGNTGPYTESSIPDGETFYDRSKALGELDDVKNLTFRNSVVGPDVDKEGVGLLNWFMQQKGSVRGFARAIWTGLTTLELAKAMEVASAYPIAGLVNMVPPESISKCDLLELFNQHLRGGAVLVEPIDEPALDKTLVRTCLAFPFEPAPYDRQIVEMAAWVRAHAHLYPHYGLVGSDGR